MGFLEFNRDGMGILEVICGPMFSGKTEELIRRIRRALIANQKVIAFKPSLDNRYSVDHIKSHNGKSFKAYVIKSSRDILDHPWMDYHVIAIDEAQFLDDDLIHIVQHMVDNGKRVIVSGLDKDFRGEPFKVMGELLAIADVVDKLYAICVKCGNPATMSQRLIQGEPAHYNSPVIMVGSSELYEPRCRKCHKVPGKPSLEEVLANRRVKEIV